MPTRFLIALSFFALAACLQNDPLRADSLQNTYWQATQVNGARFAATATLAITGKQRISGIAPCNRYSAAMAADHPAWAIGPIAATKRACPDLISENAFFAALRTAKQSVLTKDRLTLIAEDGSELLVFRPAD